MSHKGCYYCLSKRGASRCVILFAVTKLTLSADYKPTEKKIFETFSKKIFSKYILPYICTPLKNNGTIL